MPAGSLSTVETWPMLPEDFDQVVAWARAHIVVAAFTAGFCIWVSLCLMLRIWIRHRRAGFLKKVFWSAVVLVPLFGWIFYGGSFRVPELHEEQSPNERESAAHWID